MNRYLVIDEQDTVRNIIVWDGVSPYTPDDGYRLLRCQDAPKEVSMGWHLADGEWVGPQDEPPPAP